MNPWQQYQADKSAGRVAQPAKQLNPWQQFQLDQKTPQVSLSIDPTSRAINISAPQWYLDSPEFKEQVLPEFNKLVGRNITDTQFKALMDSGMQDDLSKQAQAILPRVKAISEYKSKFPKATDEDALLYYRNVAAAQNSDKDENTQVVVGFGDGGAPITRSVKDTINNLKTYSDKQRADMLAKTIKDIEDPNVSENVRAASLSLIQLSKEKGLLKADGGTSFEQGLNQFLSKIGSTGFIGKFFDNLSVLGDIGPGKVPFQQTISQKAQAALNADSNLELLEGVPGARAAGDIGAEIGGIAGDVAATAGLSSPAAVARFGEVATRLPTTASLGARVANVSPAVGAAIGTLPDATSAVRGTEALANGGKVAQTIAGTLRETPANVGFGAAQTVGRDNYDAGQDFLINTALTGATLAGAKALGNVIKSIDTASNGRLTDFSNEVSKFGLRRVKNIQDIPVIGDAMKRLSVNILDESAPVKRAFRDAYATSKGAKATKEAKAKYIEVSNLVRNATQKGAPQARAFRTQTPEFTSMLQKSEALRNAGDGVIDEANEYVNKATILERIGTGQYTVKPEIADELAERVAELRNKDPRYEAYRRDIVNATSKITDYGTAMGINDADIIAYMRDNPEFAKDYVELQYDLRATKNPFAGKGSPRNLKNTTPNKRLKGIAREDLIDPLLVANQRVELVSRIAAENGVNAFVARGVEDGVIPGEVKISAPQVKELQKLKFSAQTEKEAVDTALQVELERLGTDLRTLSDDVEDFSGSGQQILGQRIDQSIDNMTEVILDHPKLQEEITGLMDSLGEGREGAEMVAANGILHRQKANIAKSIEDALLKSPLGAEERKMVSDLFKAKITERFDGLMREQGSTGRTGAKELNERRNEIRRLRAELGSTKDVNQKDTIGYFENGQKGYVKLDDPDLADYFNSRKTPTEDGLIARFMTNASRIFRFGTTGAEPIFTLFVNPLRDIPQATVAGGVRVLAPLSPENIMTELMMTKGMSRADAQRTVAQLGLAEENSFRMATQIGVNRGDVALDGSKRRVWENDEQQLARQDKETYNKIQAETRDYLRGKKHYVINAMVPNRAFRNLENAFSEIEVATRKQIANARFVSALNRGASVEQATQEALFYGAESTANFLNMGAKTRSFVRTVPYLMAAINGSASFARLFALDPVGVTMRMFGGVAMPLTYLAANNLSTPEKQAQYSQIPEYVKRSSIVILPDGEQNPIIIPLSFELAKVVNPFREAVEALYDQDNDTFQEIFARGLLSSSPIDLSAYAMQDAQGETDLWQATQQVVSGLVPQGAKPLWSAVTGVDPYFGTSLNPSDEELIARGQVGEDEEITAGDRTFASRDSRTLRSVADATGIDQGRIENLLRNYTGTLGQYVLNTVDKLAGAPPSQQGGRDIVEGLAKRFSINLDSGGSATTDYYNMIDDLTAKKETLEAQLDRIARTHYDDEDGGASANDTRQRLIDDFGQEVATRVDNFGEFYNRIGGLKPFQVDSVIRLLDLGPDQGAFELGSYQNAGLQDSRALSRADANRRALDLGLPTTSARDLYGETTLDANNDPTTSFYSSTLPNGTIRDRVYGAPKQMAFEFSEAMKADRRNGVPSVYDLKKAYDNEISDLYEQARGLKGKAATAIYEQISDIQEQYMTEVFDVRIRPLIEKYGPEAIRNSKVAQEVEAFIEVPGDFTPFSSKKKQPYLSDDVWAYIKDRYGVGNINQQNLMNDPQATEYLRRINADIAAGRDAAAGFKLRELDRRINEGRVFVDSATMDSIAGMIQAANKRR